MKHTLIISGGSVNEEFAKSYINNHTFDYAIAVDDGLRVAKNLGITPNCILGDFDTVSPLLLYQYEDNSEIEIIRFKPNKDFTDTFAGVKKALDEGSVIITILGATGTRLDHTIANIMLLQPTLDAGVDAMIVSEKNRIRMIGNKRKSITLEKDIYRYVSLLPFSNVVTGVTTQGMKYNVSNYNFYLDKQISIGVSNEIADKQASITLEDGLMVLIESND